MGSKTVAILMVEDQPQDAQSLISELELYGLAIETHRVSSNAALDEALEQAWDIVLCDYMVPGMNWQVTLNTVRARYPHIPLLIVSGQRGEEYAVETMRAGCNDFIPKDRLMRLGPSVVRELDAAAEARRMRDDQEQLRRELQRARRLEATGQLAGGLAHNLNNILTVIMGSLDLARYEQHDGPGSEYLKDAMLATERASKMTRQLNQLAAGPSFAPSHIDLNAMLTHLQSLVRPGLPDGITLEVRTCDELPPLLADPVMLEQAVLNLLLNARDAIEGQGQIDCSASRRGTEWVIRVADTGVGIADDLHEKLFEPYYSTKGNAGTGLGLSSTYQIMRSHQGRVNVESSQGNGAAFELVAPIRESGEAHVETYHEQWQSGTGRVLVIDDTEQVLLTSQAILNECGYDVVTAAGFQAAQELLQSGCGADIIVCDSIMSEGSAVELLQWLRTRGNPVPVVVTSSFASDERHRYGAQQGFAGFLAKPFNALELSTTLADIRAPAKTAGAG